MLDRERPLSLPLGARALLELEFELAPVRLPNRSSSLAAHCRPESAALFDRGHVEAREDAQR